MMAFVPHSLHDGGFYDSLEAFRTRLGGEGYCGGVRLLKVSAPLLALASDLWTPLRSEVQDFHPLLTNKSAKTAPSWEQ